MGDMPVERTFTLGEIAEALKKNGYTWITGQMYSSTNQGHCAMGQIARNLGFAPRFTDDEDQLFEDNAWAIQRALRNNYNIDIVGFNDDRAKNYNEVVNHIVPQLEGTGLEKTITVEVIS